MNNNDPFSPKEPDPSKIPPGNPESSLRDAKKLDSLYGLQNTPTTAQIITYIILVLGLIIIFFNSLVGSALIGGVVGYYFSEEIVYYLKNAALIFNNSDPLKAIIISALLLSIFISAPGFFLGVAVAGIRHLLLIKD